MKHPVDPKKTKLDDDTSPEMVDHLLTEAAKEKKAEEEFIAKRRRSILSALRNSIKARAVVFYPACFFDWQMIKDLSAKYRCSTFIYTDWHATSAQARQGMTAV